MSATPERSVPVATAYTRLRRVIYAFRFIREMSRKGSAALETTKAFHVARTYGIEAELVRKIKARFRTELSFGGDGK